MIARLDRLLEPYGGLGAYGRADQVSHRFLADEIAQNRSLRHGAAGDLPGRRGLPAQRRARAPGRTQRDQIAVLKAFGYDDAQRGPALPGASRPSRWRSAPRSGAPLGLWLGWLINGLYVHFYRFPVLRFEPGPTVVALAVGVSATAALIGAQARRAPRAVAAARRGDAARAARALPGGRCSSARASRAGCRPPRA